MRHVTMLTLLILLTGCAGSFTGRAPETRTLTLHASPAQAYQRSMVVLTQMGTEFAPRPDRQTIQGTVHKAVVMTVLFEDQGWQTLVTATAYIPPGKLTIGQMSELEEFCERLQAMEVAHER